MIAYEKFIPENAAIAGARRIGVYKNGKRVGHIPLGRLKPGKGEKQYSFGVVSDIHLEETEEVYKTSVADCRKAFQYYNDREDIDFLCICGDLTRAGTREELEYYKATIDEYVPAKPVHVAVGNHENYLGSSSAPGSSEYYEQITGHPLYYSFEHNDDLFIMCGIRSSAEATLFEAGELDWLEGLLEANKNRRCFLFQHIPVDNGSGDPLNVHTGTKLAEHADSLRFKALLAHYKNAIHFHGHTHYKFEIQERDEIANYDNLLGAHSVHIPSLTVPRGISEDNELTGAVELSQGYIVDVYENGIHLRGRDFINDLDIPIASYWLDTTIKPVE